MTVCFDPFFPFGVSIPLGCSGPLDTSPVADAPPDVPAVAVAPPADVTFSEADVIGLELDVTVCVLPDLLGG